MSAAQCGIYRRQEQRAEAGPAPVLIGEGGDSSARSPEPARRLHLPTPRAAVQPADTPACPVIRPQAVGPSVSARRSTEPQDA